MKHKSTKEKIGFYAFLGVDVILAILIIWGLFFSHWTHSLAVFSPAGFTSTQQKKLIITAVAIMLVPALIVLAAAYTIVFKYRAERGEEYKPQGVNPRLQIVGWLFIALFIACISVINFKTAHSLDPMHAIQANAKPITIEVVALQWKWLFIYPEQNIATVNYIDIPQNVPVHFELTADAPMNLFWIPQLGGQMAAMAGMVNKLNLMATQTGEFRGTESEINGDGYSRMNFMVNSVSQNDFNDWVKTVQKSPESLTEQQYNQLSQPSSDYPQSSYSFVAASLYNNIIIKYMLPTSSPSSTMPNMDMSGMHM